jgi:hypothetical protein
MRILRRTSCRRLALLATLWPVLAIAQSPAGYQEILDRLDRLEKQNHELMEQVAALRREVAASRSAPAEAAPPAVARLEEKTAVEDQQIHDLAQTKVEASQHFPIRVTGMALFNTFLNGAANGASDYPTLASLTPGADRGGATMRQTVIGLEYQGPETLWGGKVRGSLYMDFYGSSGQALDQLLRFRTASIEVDWNSRSIMAGVEKPIFNPREPNSLAQVGVSPLTAAGNLWLWIPQVKFEQKFRLSDMARLRAQIGAVATQERLSYQASSYTPEIAPTRPGLEGRFEFTYGAPDGRRLEIAPGFHTSVSHVADTSVPSNLVSADWFFNPLSKLEFTGAFYSGQNVAHLGTGAIRQGFTVLGDGLAFPVHSMGGWAQWTWIPLRRLSFNFFAGQQDDRDSDLLPGRIGKNQKYGANFFYKLAPNVLVSFETSQLRTTYILIGDRVNNHYDLGVAYLF